MSESHSLKRPGFFAGKPLTAIDLALEQQYFLEKLRRHNRSLHGFGIVSGLKVNSTAGRIAVDAGMALDCKGNEVVIEATQTLSPPASNVGWPFAYVNIRYAEDSRDSSITKEGAPTMKEGFEITVAQENYNRGHRHLRARWLACGKPHPLTIAKLKYSSQGWRVDRRYRPPTIK